MNAAYFILSELTFINLGWLLGWLVTRRQFPFSFIAYSAIFVAVAAGYLILDTLRRNLPAMSLDAVQLAFWILMLRHYWKKRKRRGRLAALGNKARARIAEMKRRMAERPVRPVLRPVPQGV